MIKEMSGGNMQRPLVLYDSIQCAYKDIALISNMSDLIETKHMGSIVGVR